MTEDYPTPAGPPVPPQELVRRLREEAPHGIRDAGVTRELWLIAATYRAGADAELEAMLVELKAMHLPDGYADRLRDVRRPKPPSLKQQALEALDSFEGFTGSLQEVDTIRRALDSIPD